MAPGTQDGFAYDVACKVPFHDSNRPPFMRFPIPTLLLIVSGFSVGFAQDAVTSTPSIESAADNRSAETGDWFTKKSTWNGFDRFHFQCAGRDSYLVVPPIPLESRPWIWRARFPDFHDEMDVALVKAGYHVAYFDVANQFGCPKIIEKADEFYQLMVQRHKLNVKPVMEGVSRGGLFVYNWVAQHPTLVACIYCDTPVCDFLSWPLGKLGGKGTGVGSPSAWKACLKAYEMDDSLAKQFRGLPIHHASIVAKAKIPILHIVSENDRVVPPSENTYRLRDSLIEHGHIMEVISVPQGTEKSKGHHFDHPDPQRVVDFIRKHAG